MEGVYISCFMNGAAFMFFGYACYSLLMKKPRSRMQNVLGLTLVFWTFLEFKDIVLCFFSLRTEKILSALTFVDGWAVAACSFYLLELTMPGWINRKRIAVLLTPYLLFTVAYLCTFYDPLLFAYFGFILIYSIVVVFVIVRAMRRYHKYVQRNYSYSEHIDVVWLRKVMFLLVACLLIWAYSCIHTTTWGDALYYFSSVALWFVIIHYSLHQVSIPMPENSQEEELLLQKAVEENEGAEKGNSIYYMFKEELQKVMEVQQLYLNPKLTISDVAGAIGTNRTYLSSYFNNELAITFYDYINNLRVEKSSKKLLAAYPCVMNVDEIAERSGFNSTSTFRRAFLKNTGMTPLEYRKSVQT